MKLIIKIDENCTTIPTKHPLYEVQDAKALCDALVLGKYKDDVIVNTVSPDAVSVYEYYGKKRGLNVELYLNGTLSDIEKVFESFNKSYDYILYTD